MIRRVGTSGPVHDQDNPPRQARDRHREHLVRQRHFDTLKSLGEEVAEFEYALVAREKADRMMVLRKKPVVEKRETVAVRARSVLLHDHQRPDHAGASSRGWA